MYAHNNHWSTTYLHITYVRTEYLKSEKDMKIEIICKKLIKIFSSKFKTEAYLWFFKDQNIA